MKLVHLLKRKFSDQPNPKNVRESFPSPQHFVDDPVYTLKEGVRPPSFHPPILSIQVISTHKHRTVHWALAQYHSLSICPSSN